MNLLQLITSIIVWTAFYAVAENDPRNYNNYARSKRNGLIGSGVYQPSYYYPNPNQNYYPSQSNYYPSQYYSPSRSDYYYPSTSYQTRPSSNYYYYPQTPVIPSSPVSVIKSIISRQDGPLNPYGYKNPNFRADDRTRKKKKKLFVPNVWG